MSPLLFNLFFNRVATYIAQHTAAEDVITVSHLVIQIVLYADDALLLAPNLHSLQRQLSAAHAFCRDSQLVISDTKSVFMLLNCQGELTLQNSKLRQVEETRYLGLKFRQLRTGR